MSTAYSAPVSGSGGTPGAYPVFQTPAAITVVRGFQLLVALLIMVLGGLLMHGLVLGPYTFAFVCGLFTLIIALYAVLSEKVASCRAGYNYWAVLALDLLMIVFWLSSMAAVAHLRGTFKYSTYAECYDDGGTFNSGHCVTYGKRTLARRFAVAGKVGLAEMSAVAGLSALELLLFIASFAYLAHQLRLHRQAVKGGIASNDAGVVEMKGQLQPAPSAPSFAPTPSPAPVYGHGGHSAYGVPNYYEPQPVYDPYAYQPQVAPGHSPSPAPPQGPPPASVPEMYSVPPAVGNPEPYHSTPGYPAHTMPTFVPPQ